MHGRAWRNWFLAAVVTVIVAALFAADTAAQRNQPIYPAYDGFLKNPDGSLTLSFAYFSHNAETVTIPPGAANTFAPTPNDRSQPTTFRPGHWRFQCVMVVGADFDGKLVWNLTYAGTTTGTSQRMLQSNWSLVEGATELAKIDYANAPRGVCLNRAPIVRVLGVPGRGPDGRPPALTAAVTEQVNLFGSVSDEGLPRTGTLRVNWRMIRGPGTATFENPRVPRTHARFSVPGTYELELAATDSELTSSTLLNVVVTP
jgi:hypothetical protein